MAFVQFASSATGRVVRAIAGLVLVGVGLFLVQGLAGWIVALIGLVPLAAGSLDSCLAAPAFHAPLKGSEVRALASRPSTHR